MTCLLPNAERVNLTLDEVLEWMQSNPDSKLGWALYWFQNKEKYLLKDITYQDALKVKNRFMAVRFFPYGYNPDRDHDVKNNLTSLEILKLSND